MNWDNLIKNFVIYLNMEKGLSENSILSYKRDVLKLKEYFIDIAKTKKSVKELELEDLQTFLSWINDIGLGAKSQARLISGIKAFFLYLLQENIIQNNITELIDMPKLGRKLPYVLSVEEIDKIIEAIDRSTPEGERNVAIIETLYGSGLRVSELINLKISEIFWEEEFIRIIGKGNKQRLVPISPKAIKHLKIYIKEVRSKKNINPEYIDYAFLNRRGNKLTRVMIFTIVKQLGQKIELKKRISPHTFRHSFATHLIEGGANLRAVQDLLGHSSITTTEIYTHLDQSYLKQMILDYHPWANK